MLQGLRNSDAAGMQLISIDPSTAGTTSSWIKQATWEQL
jgi:hypothetical protein